MNTDTHEQLGLAPSKIVAGTCSFGIGILIRKLQLKLDVMIAGKLGVESIIEALISMGLSEREEIVSEVCAIAGDHVSDLVHHALAEGCGRYWEFDMDEDAYAPLRLN